MLFVSLAVAPHGSVLLSKSSVLLALFCTLLISSCHDNFVLSWLSVRGICWLPMK